MIRYFVNACFALLSWERKLIEFWRQIIFKTQTVEFWRRNGKFSHYANFFWKLSFPSRFNFLLHMSFTKYTIQLANLTAKRPKITTAEDMFTKPSWPNSCLLQLVHRHMIVVLIRILPFWLTLLTTCKSFPANPRKLVGSGSSSLLTRDVTWQRSGLQ